MSAMPSQLTRLVFRRLIANEPLLYRGCQYHSTRPRLVNHGRARALPHIQQRTFFDLFKQKRKGRKPETPPGLDVLGELAYAQKKNLRPPKPQVIADALKSFLVQKQGRFEDFHIARARVALDHLLETPQEDGTPWFTPEELDKYMFAQLIDLARRPERSMEEHLKFGRVLVEEMAKPETKLQGVAGGMMKESKKLDDADHTQKLIQILCIFGAAKEAREIVASKYKYDPKATSDQRRVWREAWNQVFAGIAQEGNTQEMLATIEQYRELSFPLITSIQAHLVKFFAERGDLASAKSWYSQPTFTFAGNPQAQARVDASAAMLKACAITGDHTFGQQIVTALLTGEAPNKEIWDAILLWSAATGRGPEEIDRQIGVMMRRSDEARQKNPAAELIRPDVDTMNGLVAYAISKNDPYMAERYIAVVEKRGILPNEKTFAMQIHYRLGVNDMDGAQAAYLNLQGDFTGAQQSVAAINKLIQAMCEHRSHQFDELMVIVDDLHERRSPLTPETVAAICILHLRRGEIHDAKDLLQVHAHQFDPAARRVIQVALLNFIVEDETSTADAWDSYQILRNVFAETPRNDRMQVMNNFFARKRPDMACHVFFHMRNHISEKYGANREVYIDAFTGFARCGDAESLELVHNQLKMDFKIEHNTKLRNALMLAYASTKENLKALRFWKEICDSREGPSYNSIAIAFRACEGMNFGYDHAKSIWKRLKEQDIEIDKNLWVAYMSATARNHQHDDALALIETVEEEYGFVPDLEM